VLELRRISLTFAGDVADHLDYVAKASKHELACFRYRYYENKRKLYMLDNNTVEEEIKNNPGRVDRADSNVRDKKKES
jgi:hypothetical protein